MNRISLIWRSHPDTEILSVEAVGLSRAQLGHYASQAGLLDFRDDDGDAVVIGTYAQRNGLRRILEAAGYEVTDDDPFVIPDWPEDWKDDGPFEHELEDDTTRLRPRTESLTIDDVEISGWSDGHPLWQSGAWVAAIIDRRSGQLSPLIVYPLPADLGGGFAWGADYWVGGVSDRGDIEPRTLEQAMLEAEDAVLSRFDHSHEWQRPGLPVSGIERR